MGVDIPPLGGDTVYIEPNTDIYLLKNVKLDAGYEDTIYFNSEPEQSAYFLNKVAVRTERNTYQRVTRNKCRLGASIRQAYNCNYMMFHNTNFLDKWFYAFVLNVEYINNATIEVTYELDVMQTWLFDFTRTQCFVEREHAKTDTPGDNLMDDSLELGEYNYTYIGAPPETANLIPVVCSTVNRDLTDAVGKQYGGVYQGLSFLGFANPDAVNTHLNSLLQYNKQDSVINIFMYPLKLWQDAENSATPVQHDFNFKKITTFGSYVPKNKKLLTHPYCQLYVTNNEGGTANYKYEDFKTEGAENYCNFELFGALSSTPEVVIFPVDYKNVPFNYNEKFTLGNYPQCAWVTDAYKAYIAQNANQLKTADTLDIITGIGNTIQSVAGLAASIMAPTPTSIVKAGVADSWENASAAGSVGGVVNSITGSIAPIAMRMAKKKDIATKPAQANGNNTMYANVATRNKNFDFYDVRIKEEFARSIDSFWALYGYPINQLKVPSIKNRKYWTYVKTVGAHMTGNVPQDYLQGINKIFDSGIRWWTNGDNIGNYNLDNTIL